MNPGEVFSIDSDIIELRGVDAIIKFTRYNPQKPKLFLGGLELSEDLLNESGTVLYTRGTNISPDRVARLLRLRESDAEMNPLFKIKRSAELIQGFRKRIKSRVKKIVGQRMETKGFQSLVSDISNKIEEFMDEILTDENFTLTIYKDRKSVV